jgi:Tfp pilus assembly protein PilE
MMNYLGLHHNLKIALYVVGGTAAAYITLVIIALVACFAFAAYLQYAKGKRADKIRAWVTDQLFIKERMKAATPEEIRKAGGKKAYKQLVKGAIAMARLKEAVELINDEHAKQNA